MPVIGRVHSVETLGTHDGPGLRCVFFLAGCNFRCQFCQNPDTWSQRGSQKMSLAEARERLRALLPYLKGGGGVTVSGGEPCMQPDFVIGLFQIAHSLGLSTVLDTNGSCPPGKRAALLAESDFVLLDVKASTEALHREITGKPLAPVLAFGRQAAQKPGRLTLRRVLLPGLNDAPEQLELLAQYALGLDHQPEIELIPYHRLGVHKWKELGYGYPLARLEPPTLARWNRVAAYLRNKGLLVKQG